MFWFSPPFCGLNQPVLNTVRYFWLFLPYICNCINYVFFMYPLNTRQPRLNNWLIVYIFEFSMSRTKIQTRDIWIWIQLLYHWTNSYKLRQSKWSRSTNRLISWLFRLLIDFFDPNLKPDFNSSWRNRLNCVRIRDWNRSKMIEKVEIYRLFRYKSTFFLALGTTEFLDQALFTLSVNVSFAIFSIQSTAIKL